MAEKNTANKEQAKADGKQADKVKTAKAKPEAKTAGKQDEAKLAALEQQLEDAKKAQDELKNNLLRTAAEYENFRKRSQKEHDAAFSNGVNHAVVKLLPIIDTLDAAANAETTDEDYKKGVLMTLAQCEEIFKSLGITEIDALNQPFDPEFHDACMQQPCEGVESGTVTMVMKKGYKQGDKVVRHAVVAVAP